MVTLADKYAILGQHAQADMARAQADQMRAQSVAREAYHERMAAQNPQRLALEQEARRAQTYGMQADADKTVSEKNRIDLLAPHERDKIMADVGHLGAQTRDIDETRPYRNFGTLSQGMAHQGEAQKNVAQSYLMERAATPPGQATPTDPRSLAFQGYRGLGGMAAPNGTYAPAPSASPLGGPTRTASGGYLDSVGREYPASPAPAPAPSPPVGAPPPIAPARNRTRPPLDLGDTASSTTLNSTAGLTSNFSSPFAARGMTNFSGNSLSSRTRAGTGIYSAPSSSFTSMIGKDPAMGLADTKDPLTGQGYGMVPSVSTPSFGWENPANKRY